MQITMQVTEEPAKPEQLDLISLRQYRSEREPLYPACEGLESLG
jgi:hypothetical protein